MKIPAQGRHAAHIHVCQVLGSGTACPPCEGGSSRPREGRPISQAQKSVPKVVYEQDLRCVRRMDLGYAPIHLAATSPCCRAEGWLSTSFDDQPRCHVDVVAGTCCGRRSRRVLAPATETRAEDLESRSSPPAGRPGHSDWLPVAAQPPSSDVKTGQRVANCLSNLFHTAWGDARWLIREPPRESVAMNEIASGSPHHLGELSPHHDDGSDPDGGAGSGSDCFAHFSGQALTWPGLVNRQCKSGSSRLRTTAESPSTVTEPLQRLESSRNTPPGPTTTWSMFPWEAARS